MMTKASSLSTLFIAVLLVGMAGCSDPAGKVPKSGGNSPQTQAAGAGAEAAAGGRTFAIQPSSKIGFVGSKVTGQHNGGFTNISGNLTVSDGKIVGNPEIRIDMKTTWADNDRLTGHLRSADFLDVQKFTVSTFKVTAIEPAATGSTVSGNLTLHGVTKSISFPAAIQVDKDLVTVRAQFAINRKDFNITYPGMPNDLIRDNVVIKLDLAAAP